MPLAGLLAETGLTLREDGGGRAADAGRDTGRRARADAAVADEFCDLHASDLTVELRRDLLDRLGMFGVRVAAAARSAAGRDDRGQLGPQLVEHSGLGELRRVIAEHFLPRARVLQARSALVAAAGAGRRAAFRRTRARPTSSTARPSASRPAPSSSPRSAPPTSWPAAQVQVSDGERRRAQTLLLADGAAAALGLDDGRRTQSAIRSAARCTRSSRGAAGPPTRWPTRRLVEVFEAAARTCESMYASATV